MKYIENIYEISVEYSKNIYILDIFLAIIWEFRLYFQLYFRVLRYYIKNRTYVS